MFNNKNNSSIVEYLKGPELVVRIQEFFGIKYCNSNNNNNNNNNNKQKDSGKIKKTVNNNNNSNNYTDYNNNNNYNYLKNTSKRIQDDKVLNHRSTATTTRSSINNDKKSSSIAESENNGTKTADDGDDSSIIYYEITNKFWYYLFIIGTEFGDELFYATMIPFWFWNIDGAVGRRVVFIWSIVMYVGQSLKDVIRWPRPGWPVQRLQSKWGLEYGMPSTHAMVSIAMPFSVVLFMIDRYQFSIIVGFILSIIWSSIICISRVYLGMHSVLDIIVGLLLTIVLMIPLIPLVNYLDFIILSYKFAPLFILTISILMVIYYPRSDKWTPTRGDTTMTLSVTAGIQIGAWLNYQSLTSSDNMITYNLLSPGPYQILWPTYPMIGLLILRTILGLCCVIGTRAIGKSICYAVVCTVMGRDKRELQNAESTLENREKIFVELTYKYITCFMIGFNTIYLLPNVFKLLNIGRPDFYTEI